MPQAYGLLVLVPRCKSESSLKYSIQQLSCPFLISGILIAKLLEPGYTTQTVDGKHTITTLPRILL